MNQKFLHINLVEVYCKVYLLFSLFYLAYFFLLKALKIETNYLDRGDKIMIIWLTGQPGSGKTTLANSIIKTLKQDKPDLKIINLDGDDLRLINKNKDYSKEGRIRNISTAISIMRFLSNKDYICIVSIVAPYRFLRDELKDDFTFLEVYLHTTEIRGREDFFAKDYEVPIDPKHLAIDTGKLTIKESLDEILDVYRKMATVA